MRGLRRLLAGIIVINVLIIMAAQIAKRMVPPSGDEHTDEFDIVAIMDGVEFESHARSFRAGTVLAAMGGVELDFSDAEIAPGGAYLELRTYMGGIDVSVPADWRVEMRGGRSIAGGREASLDNDRVPAGAPTLTIEASAVMGGVDVHHRPRARAVAYAG
ncbi:MAG: hypothetical protein GEU80_00055 [Dehalococcoidia bacterium]|nr:hypothetical protein [Dehalococcoidia bacterium]